METDGQTTQASSDPEPQMAVAEEMITIPFAPTFVYSNCTAFCVTHMDFRISFGELMPDRTAQARVGIVMPPEHAAVLMMSLFQQVNQFEQQFGEIRHPAWKAWKQGADPTGLLPKSSQAANRKQKPKKPDESAAATTEPESPTPQV